jgi:hypothetical protein
MKLEPRIMRPEFNIFILTDKAGEEGAALLCKLLYAMSAVAPNAEEPYFYVPHIKLYILTH